jgi:hypothetical protein
MPLAGRFAGLLSYFARHLAATNYNRRESQMPDNLPKYTLSYDEQRDRTAGGSKKSSGRRWRFGEDPEGERAVSGRENISAQQRSSEIQRVRTCRLQH